MQQKEQNIKFFITGFGPFGKHEKNPTQILIESLTEEEMNLSNIIEKSVLEVSMEAVKEYYNQKYQKIAELNQQQQNQNQKYCFLHFGLYQGCGKFRLEQYGYNMANFFIPDMKNQICKNELICQKLELDQPLKTNLNLEKCCQELQNKQYDVTISDNPGRYICNYIYFNSLQNCQQLCTEITKNDNVQSLFIHVPNFDEIDQQTQKSFLFEIIQQIQKL